MPLNTFVIEMLSGQNKTLNMIFRKSCLTNKEKKTCWMLNVKFKVPCVNIS